jgi:hypothetical protein
LLPVDRRIPPPGVDEIVVLIDSQRAMGRKAFDRERPGHADFLLVLVRLVVEIFELRLGGDRGVGFLLPRNASFPERSVKWLRGWWPFGILHHGFQLRRGDVFSRSFFVGEGDHGFAWLR